MKVFGRGRYLATEVAVGGPSDSENPTEKKNTPTVIDDAALERVPSLNMQDGVKKVEAITLTWTRNQLIIAYGWSELQCLLSLIDSS
jgi:hypothetical protein